MVHLEQIGTPWGIPVYFQRLPDLVRSVSLKLIVFTGSADDTSVGLPGLYHWFEHVPFRGTENFTKKGIEEIERYGGGTNAHTSTHYTAFECDTPRKLWQRGLAILADLVGLPLLAHESIVAEREIIQQEINSALSSIESYAFYHRGDILWPNHPLAHCPLGTPDSLNRTSPVMLEVAHQKGYGRNRCLLLVTGNLEKEEVLREAETQLRKIPERPLSERRRPASYGPKPEWRNDRLVIDTDFASSLVLLVFPLEPSGAEWFENYCAWNMLNSTIIAGNLQSPLMRIIREERQLVYGATSRFNLCPDGGDWGMGAMTSFDKIEQVVEAFYDTLQDAQTFSPDWNEYVKDTFHSSADMRPVSASDYTEMALTSLVACGEVASEEKIIQGNTSIAHSNTVDLLRTLHPFLGRVIVFQGLGGRRWSQVMLRKALKLVPFLSR